MLPLCCDKKSISSFVVIWSTWVFLLYFSAILTIRLVEDIAHSALLQIGWECTSPFLINFLLLFKIFGIKNKGFIKEGFDADFTIVDMNKTIEIKNENIESKCGWTPFNGDKFKGTPTHTIIAGKIKMQDGKILGDPEGKPLAF